MSASGPSGPLVVIYQGVGPDPLPLSGSLHVKKNTFCCDTMLWQEQILAWYMHFKVC